MFAVLFGAFCVAFGFTVGLFWAKLLDGQPPSTKMFFLSFMSIGLTLPIFGLIVLFTVIAP